MRGRSVWLALALASMIAPPALAETARKPAFVPAPCDLPGVTPALAPRLRCGTVAVPAEPGTPTGPKLRLAVVVLAPVGVQAETDPVVYIAGGPGSPLTSRAALLALHEAAVVAPGRELVLVDQRGIGRSEPELCPGLSHEQLAVMAAGFDQAALLAALRTTYDICREEMAAAGQDPSWFGTTVTAADFDAVRDALGIERWTVYALSYGTAVAMTMMAQHPDRLRAVVLDSVFPPDPLPLSAAQSFERARQSLFADCRANAICGAEAPDLAEAYDDAIGALASASLSVPLPPGFGRQTFELRADTFRLIVDAALYSRTRMAALPAFIMAVRDRNAPDAQALVVAAARNYRNMATGAMAAVECRDRPSWHSAETSAEPPVDSFVPGLCRSWPGLGPPPVLPTDTEIPTLVLSGAVDPITPPEFARLVAAALGRRATLIEFAHTGHGVQQATPCGEAIVTAFVRDPNAAIDANCAAQIGDIPFR